MQIVINIPNSTFTDLKKKQNRTEVDVAVLNGTPLPKGHGRLIDESQITEVYTDATEPVKINGMTVIPTRIVIAGTNAPTIIKADTESEVRG